MEHQSTSASSSDVESEDSHDNKDRERERTYKTFYEAALTAVEIGDTELLGLLMNYLFQLYDWEDSCYDDYSFELIKRAVLKNNSNTVLYLLQRKEEGDTEDEVGTQMAQNEQIKTVVVAACATQNLDMIKLALDFAANRHATLGCNYTMYNEEFFSALKSGNEEIASFILKHEQLNLLYNYYDNWKKSQWSVQGSLNRAAGISRNILDLVLCLLEKYKSRYYAKAVEYVNKEDV